MKMPRYFTEGLSDVKSPTRSVSRSRCRTGASAHQYHGLTPMARDTESNP